LSDVLLNQADVVDYGQRMEPKPVIVAFGVRSGCKAVALSVLRVRLARSAKEGQCACKEQHG